MTEIILKQGTGEPGADKVNVAEVAIDTGTGNLYTKLADGSVKHLNPEYGTGGGGESLWEQNGDDIYYAAGNVGIGTQNIDESLVVQGSIKLRGANSVWFTNTSGLVGVDCLNSNLIRVTNDNSAGQVALRTNGADRLTIDPAGDATFSGNVGIGYRSTVDSPLCVGTSVGKPLAVRLGSLTSAEAGQDVYVRIQGKNTAGTNRYFDIRHILDDGALTINGPSSSFPELMRLSSDGATFSGNVGIGMAPVRVRAKEQLKEWKTKAKKASWPIVTDGAFEQEPTEELVEQWIETRAAGDALQVNGNGSFSSTLYSAAAEITNSSNSNNALRVSGPSSAVHVRPNGTIYRDGGGGVQFTNGSIRSINGTGSEEGGIHDIGRSAYPFKDAYFSGTVNAETFNGIAVYRAGQCGLQFASGQAIVPTGGTINALGDTVDLGSSTFKFKDAHFSGTVNATTINGRVTDVGDHIKAITPTQIANWDAGTGGGGGATTDGRIKDEDIVHWNQAWGWGNHNDANYQPAGNYEIAGTAYTKAESDAKYELKGQGGGGDYVPLTGNSTVAGTITATDFVATSDERVKDNVTTAPVGLIDSIKGREWDWKESGEKGSGVVAQELEQVLPHLVHTDDEGMKSVSYMGLCAYLIEEVKALKAEVQELKA